jgi:hypothetical protein
MVTARADVYRIASGQDLYAGRAGPAIYAVVQLLKAAPSESWVRLNADTNTMQSVYPPDDLRTRYGSGPAPAEPIQGAWPSFGWDSNDHQLVLWGGGHANTSANEVYVWRCEDRSWHLAYLPSAAINVDGYPTFRSVDFGATPVSSHTYGNNNFLPILNRFFTALGAAHGTGGLMGLFNESNVFQRSAGAYTLNMSQARQNKVAGLTGSNNKSGAYAGVDIEGAEAWYLRDWYSAGSIPNGSRLDNGTAYLTHNGHDALLMTTGNRTVWRIEFVDQNWANDIITQVGAQGDAVVLGQGQVAYDPAAQVLVAVTNGANARMVEFLDMKRTLGAGNGWRGVTLAPGAARDEFVALNIRWCGLVHNPIKGCFTIWNMGAQVWEVYPPAGSPTPDDGWVVVKPTMAGATAPRSNYITTGPNQETGIIGKFRWAPDLNAAVTTFGNQAGEVWAYKSSGWTNPLAG